MKVKLLTYTPIEVAYFSAKTCYSKKSPIELVKEDTSSMEEKIKFLKKILSTGHYSTIEGVNFTFLIEGVSRSLMAQLTRHRIGIQFSIQSQRYVEYSEDNYNIYIPSSIKNNSEALKIYKEIQDECFRKYKVLMGINIPAEDARYVLTNATCTNITMTVNLRELIHLAELRLCNRASLEIRILLQHIKEEVLYKEPWLENYITTNCEKDGFCKEAKSCGRKPKLSDILTSYNNDRLSKEDSKQLKEACLNPKENKKLKQLLDNEN